MNKILIIDDDPTICIMLQGLLNKKGFESEIAFSANEGLKKFGSFKPNLVISDFRLPDINGLDLLKKLKSLSPHMPVIIMTSYAEIRTAVNAIKLGAYEYVTKPLNPEEILVLIKSAISKPGPKKKVFTEIMNKVKGHFRESLVTFGLPLSLLWSYPLAVFPGTIQA